MAKMGRPKAESPKKKNVSSRLTEEEYQMVVKSVMEQEGPKNHPFAITEADVIGAVKTADAIGQMYLEGKSLI